MRGCAVLLVACFWFALVAAHVLHAAAPHRMVQIAFATTPLLQASGGRRSVREGVYTESQAKRGRDSYEYSCATCHLVSLDGDPGRDIPALYGEEFLAEWSKHTVKDLFDLIQRSMPADSAGSLRPETYIDIVAYLLQANKFPPGDNDLTTDTASLDQVAIDKSPSGK
jgi:cytochrome c5